MPTLLMNSSSERWPREAQLSTRPTRQHGLYRLALLAGIAVFLIVSYWDSFSSLFALWQHSDHRHGTLVFPIVAFLVWRLRPAFENLPITSEPRGFLLILGLLLVWTASRLAGIQVVEHAVVLALIPATIYAVVGREITSRLLFPLSFIILATPIGDSLIPHLMRVTADISTALLRVSGFPVLRSGQYISLPGGDFVVADVCSGVRYLTTGILIALLYSHLTYKSHVKWLVFIAITAVVLVLTNGVRAYLVMAVASASEFQYLGGRDHIYFGWLMFGIVITLLMWFGGRYADHHFHPHAQELGDEDETISPSLPLIAVLGLIMLATTTNPLQADLGNSSKYLILVAIIVGIVILAGRSQIDPAAIRLSSTSFGTGAKWRSLVSVIAVAILLIAVPQSVLFVENAAAKTVTIPVIETLEHCTNPRPWANRWLPRMQDPDIQKAVTLTCAGLPVSIYVAGYSSALQGRELISGSNRLIPDSWDRYTHRSVRDFTDSDGRVRQVNEVRIDGPDYKGLIWYWYDIDGRWATGEFAAKALQVVALLRTRPAGGQVILIEAAVVVDEGSTRRRIEGVANAIISGQSLMVNGKSD